MRILLTQSDGRAGLRARAVLENAGHEVLACTDERGEPFPCAGVGGGRCPLDEGAVVAVSAPGLVPPVPQAGDVGVICALRHHLPVVVVAPESLSWLDDRTGLVDPADLPAAVELAAAAPLEPHTRTCTEEARRLVGGDVRATVTRVGTGLRVDIDTPDDVDDKTAQALAVRVQTAVRRIDRWATGVDVNTRARPAE
jgi:hypothetical protein